MTSFNGGGNGIVLAAAAAMLALAGCGGSANDALPLIRVAISVKTISAGGECETIPVRISPIALSGVANKYANNRMMVTDVAMNGPSDENGAPMCNGTGESLPLAPGEWEFSAPLRSGPHSCRIQVANEGGVDVIFVDGLEGCSGAPVEPEMPEVPEMPEGTDPMTGEGDMEAAPADEAAPAG